MVRRTNNTTIDLFSFSNLGITIPPDHDLVQLKATIPWNELVSIISNVYSSVRGRRSLILRMMIALEIVKRRYRYSDEDLVMALRSDVAIMNFCGFDSFYQGKLHSTSMTKFRNRLTPDILHQIDALCIRTVVRTLPTRHRHEVVGDTTCVPANIAYPTDVSLLSKSITALTTLATQARSVGYTIALRGKHTITKIVKKYQRTRKHTQEQTEMVRAQLVAYGQQLHVKVSSLINTVCATTDVACVAMEAPAKILKRLQQTHAKILDTTATIFTQQAEMLRTKTHSVADRIVSLHEPKVRPIPRGKVNAPIECGRKVAFNLVGGKFLLPVYAVHENRSDTEAIKASVETHERIFGRKPHTMMFDKGGHAPDNHQYLKEHGILDGIDYRGRTAPSPIDTMSAHTRKRLYCRRTRIEGKIGTAKTHYGLDRNRYKDDNAPVLLTFAILTMNFMNCI